MGQQWIVGALINLAGSILINLGTNVMKLGHNKRALTLETDSGKPPIRTFREWQGGVTMFIIGNLANFASFGFAAQSLLAALGTVQFVSNVVFAFLVLHERVTWRVLAATGCIVGGCVILVVFGNHESPEFTTDDLKHLYGRPAYIVYLVVMSVTVTSMYLVYRRGRRYLDDPRAPVGWRRTLPIAYALYAGMLGTQSVLFSKALSTLLRTTFTTDDNQLRQWFTYFVIVAFVLAAGFWVTRLNKGLRMFPAIVIVPTMQISWTLFSIVSGAIYYEEYKALTGLGIGMFCLGVAVVIGGVLLLTSPGAQGMESLASAPGDTDSFLSGERPGAEDDRDDLVFESAAGLATGSKGSESGLRVHRRSRGSKLDSDSDVKYKMEAGLTSSTVGNDPLSPSLGTSPAGSISGPIHAIPIPASPFSGVLPPGSSQGASPADSRRPSSSGHFGGQLVSDFGVEASTVVRDMLGMGSSDLPAYSVFGMPMLGATCAADVSGTHGTPPRAGQHSSPGHGAGGGPHGLGPGHGHVSPPASRLPPQHAKSTSSVPRPAGRVPPTLRSTHSGPPSVALRSGTGSLTGGRSLEGLPEVLAAGDGSQSDSPASRDKLTAENLVLSDAEMVGGAYTNPLHVTDAEIEEVTGRISDTSSGIGRNRRDPASRPGR